MLKKAVVALLAAGVLLVAQTRLADSVRNDVFAGLSGDMDAFKRAIDACEKILAENPNHAEALVWHGIALFSESGQDRQDPQKSMALFQKGVSEMDRAAVLEPDNLAVRIPRGAAFRLATPGMPDFLHPDKLIEEARSDYQLAFDRQKDYLDRLGTHPLGELLQGLGDLYSRQGKPDEAQKYYEMIQTMLKNTEYEKRAAAWMKTKQPLPAEQTGCIGCHAGK